MKKNVFTKAILAATAAVAIACTSPAYAAPDAAPKIGVVSLERVLHDSAPAKAATEKLQKEFARRENYDLIVQDAVYVSPRVDITDKVLKALK